MSSVIYLTGAPATGKSTLSRNLKAAYPEVLLFAYSEQLRDLVGRRLGNESLGEDEIRRQSSQVVTAQDVIDLDKQLIETVRSERSRRPVLIDSHAVTKEAYGFRVTAFSVAALQALDPDVIICLYASSAVVLDRIRRHPSGRPTVTEFEADFHTHGQVALAIQYGVILGKPVYLVDSAASEDDLVSVVATKAKL